MSDFIADLERELLGAARRRARKRARPRLWRSATRPLRPLSPARALAVLALLAAVAAAAAGISALHSTDQPAAPPPFSRLQLKGGVAATTCGTTPVTRRVNPVIQSAPAEVVALLAVLRRPQKPSDRTHIADFASGMPISDYDPHAVRALPFYSSGIWIVPTNDVRTETLSCGGGEHLGPGACVLISFESTCFTVADIRAGRAFGLIAIGAYGRLVGLLPDGKAWGLFKVGGHTRGLHAVGNVVEKYLPHTGPGATLDYALYPRVPTTVAPTSTVARKLASRLQVDVVTQHHAGNELTVFAPDANLGDAVAAITGGTRSSEAMGADVVVRMR
jgi:hypothetical protein